MCLAQIGEVKEVIDDRSAVCDVDGAERGVSLVVLTLEGSVVETGDWLLIHTGLAVAVLEPAEARQLAEFHHELAESGLDQQGQEA